MITHETVKTNTCETGNVYNIHLLSYSTREFFFCLLIRAYSVSLWKKKMRKFKCQNECVEVENSREGSLKSWYKNFHMLLN